MNIIKGLLLAIGGAILGIVLWFAVIFIIGGGTGGAVGGLFASFIGILIAAAYKKGSGRAGFIGFLVVIVFVIASVFTAITVGTAAILYNGGMGYDLLDSMDILMDLLETDNNFSDAFAGDFLVSTGIALGMGIITLLSGNKKKGVQAKQNEESGEI